MLDELKKSFHSVINERITSPLSGALIISWLAWNWKILYLLFWGTGFETTEKLFAFIKDDYCDVYYNFIYPFASAVLIVAIYPILTTIALWISLKYKFKQNQIKNSIEKNKLLTIEQSLELRLEMENLKEKYSKMFEEKNQEINRYKQSYDELLKNYNDIIAANSTFQKNPSPVKLIDNNDYEDEIRSFNYKDEFKAVINNILRNSHANSGVSDIGFGKIAILDLIEKVGEPYYYKLTGKGKIFAKKLNIF